MEEAWEFAVVSVGLSYTDFSSRYVRIKYLAVLSALLVAAAGKYGIEDIGFLKVITLEDTPSDLLIFLGLWLFSAFNIYGFLQRYRYEKPLIPYTLVSLRTILESAQEFFKNQQEESDVLCEEVRGYKKFNYDRPLPEFDRDLANEVSATLLRKQTSLLPSIRHYDDTLDKISENGAAHHFTGPNNYYSMVKENISLLREHHESVFSIAKQLSSLKRSREDDPIYWPEMLTTDELLRALYKRCRETVDNLIEIIPSRERIEKSLTFTLAFNVPFWVSVSLFVYGTIEFLLDYWPTAS